MCYYREVLLIISPIMLYKIYISGVVTNTSLLLVSPPKTNNNNNNNKEKYRKDKK